MREGIKTELKEGVEKLTESESIEKKEEFNFPEIAELEEPMKKILDELRPELERGTYNSLVGDDRGGRLPLLALREVVNHIYEGSNRKRISGIFISPGRFSEFSDDLVVESHKAAMREYVARQKKIIGHKTLVVTDHIASGGTISRIGQALRSSDIAFDVFTPFFGLGYDSSDSFLKFKKRFNKEFGSKVFWGRTFGIPEIWPMSRSFHGLEKGKPGDVLSKRSFFLPVEVMKQVREEDAHLLAQHLIEYYDFQTKNRTRIERSNAQ